MWRIVFTSLLLFACSPSPKEESNDRARLLLLKKLFDVQLRLDSVQTDNAELIKRQQRASDNNKAMIQQTLNYNMAILNDKFSTMKMNDALAERDEIIKEDKELKKKNEQLLKENEGYKYKLNSEIENHSATKKQKAMLEKEISDASMLSISSIRIIGVGYSLIGKREMSTTKAGRIKNVAVFFTFPANTLAVKEAKKITITMYSADSKDDVKRDTTINYVGAEYNMALYLKPKIQFKAGKHLINITVNSKLQAEKEFNIVN